MAFEIGTIVCISTQNFSVIGRIFQFYERGTEIIGLTKDEKEKISKLSFFKTSNMTDIPENMHLLISEDKIILVSTGVELNDDSK